ncbi:indolepyruvate ferredoxin oxidoreductase family protein [Mycobacterium sp. 3519A]|uniref:indolepyruvate ferredoxin oxidoreductase family protein n=1 Tax=Mycobacterium sp. 3519A TaxID=2057184 RepID=UPI000C795CB1|nr:indolepyruvate ferredoxin oxidoreductase family protein [Mycobacterium sp. 3519A]
MEESNPLARRYSAIEGTVQLTGIQALVRVPIDQRRSDIHRRRSSAAFISGYEGSPLAGYDLELARQQQLLDDHDIVFAPAVNEELAATAVQGTQLAAQLPDCRVDGIVGYWYGKSPGLDRASDALRHNNLAGTHPDGGAVLFVGDDPGAKSSTVPGSSEVLLADLGVPTLSPADPQDLYNLGLHSVAMSRSCGLWSAVKIATAVADGAGPVTICPQHFSPHLPQIDGRPFRHSVTGKLLQPRLAELEHSRNSTRLDLARRYAQLNGLNRITDRGPSDRIGIVAAGKTYLDVRQALLALNIDDAELTRRGIRLLRLGMIYPLEPTILRGFAAGLSELIIVEEKRAFIEMAVKDCLYGVSSDLRITGKRNLDGSVLLRDDGELTVDLVRDALSKRFADYTGLAELAVTSSPQSRRRVELPLATRSPYFCSGCPHNTSTKTPPGSLVGAGIGCHGLIVGMRPHMVGDVTGLTQMGGEGAQWLGMQPFLERQHILQNLGDGTFHHSASLAVRAAIAARANITYKLLYNSTVAMTGGQDAVGQMSIPRICRALTAEGVAKIIVTTEDAKAYRRRLPRNVQVWSRDRIVEAQQHLATIRGVTFLIHDQECATELRRKRKRGTAPEPPMRIAINQRVCEGCGDCGVQSNCLSVHPVDTEFGRKTTIDQSSCNKDYSCLAGDCPSFVSVVPAGGEQPNRTALEALSADAYCEPARQFFQTSHTTRVLGVGGSGVVTLSQILGTAAAAAQLHVVSLDQTGIAQKGGAVVSDIKVTRSPMELASRAADGEVDLYLGADLLVAAEPKNLRAADPARTVAVISTSKVPTGDMVTDTSASYPQIAELTDAISQGTRAAAMVQLDARAHAETLFGSDQFATLLLAGAAYQTGALPIPAAQIEYAIGLNGVAVEDNIQAFRRGRQFVADPHGFTEAVRRRAAHTVTPAVSSQAAELIASVGAAPASELHKSLTIRVPDLIAYQNVGYARRYVEVVSQIARVEGQVLPGDSAISEAVARNLYKLMAYKDEYEVARLSLDPAFTQSIQAAFGAGARVSYRLHPPLLRMLGMRHKISLGPWFRYVYAALVWMRPLRGTPLDPFGWTGLRRLERRLIDEYIDYMSDLAADLTPRNAAMVAEAAALPDLIRGYEQIKVDNVVTYRERMTLLVDAVRAQARPATG